MQKVIVALLLGAAAAFVGPAPRAAPAALRAEAAEGGRYDFDPMNFAGRYPGMVPWFREAELKHGRMCMLATIGMVVPAFVRVPGEQFQGSYIGWEAHDRLVASGALGQILLFVGLFE